MLSKFNIGKKVLKCPSCKQQIRVPVKSSKTLRIRCPKCNCQFDIKFSNPIKEIIQWNKNLSLMQNFSSMKWRFKSLPARAKLLLVLLLISILFLIFSISARLFFPAGIDTKTPSQKTLNLTHPPKSP